MKYLIVLLASISFLNSQSQQTSEYLVEFNENYSVNHARIITKDNGSHYLYVYSTKYDSDDTTAYIHGNPDYLKTVVRINNNGVLRDHYNLDDRFMFYEREFIHTYGNNFAGVASREDQITTSTYTMPCNQLIVGSVDTTGLSDTLVQSYNAYVDVDCDFVNGGYMRMAYSNGYYYVLYQKRNADGEGIHLLKVKEDMTSSTKTLISEKFHQAEVKPDGSGFYIFCENPSNEFEFRLAEMDLDGNISYLSPYISFSTEKDQPWFLYNGEALFTFPKNHYTYTEVRKYKLNGQLIGVYDSGFITQKIFNVVGGLFVVQRSEYWNGDPKPLKLALLDYDFNNILAEHELGYKNLFIDDINLDLTDGSFVITGSTRNSTLEPSFRDKDDVYILLGNLTELTDGEEESSSEETLGQFYPNPSQDSSVYLKLEHDSNKELKITTIRFHDMNGKLIDPQYRQTSSGLYEINTSGLSNGIYLGTAMSNSTVVASQLLVVKK